MTKYRLITITMWNINPTKADKRYCRELIHIGLERECEKFVKDMQRLANKPIPLAELNEPYREENGWSVEGPWHKRYIALYKKKHPLTSISPATATACLVAIT